MQPTRRPRSNTFYSQATQSKSEVKHSCCREKDSIDENVYANTDRNKTQVRNNGRTKENKNRNNKRKSVSKDKTNNCNKSKNNHNSNNGNGIITLTKMILNSK